MVRLVVASEIEASMGVVLVEGLAGVVIYNFFFLVIDSCVYRVVCRGVAPCRWEVQGGLALVSFSPSPLSFPFLSPPSPPSLILGRIRWWVEEFTIPRQSRS